MASSLYSRYIPPKTVEIRSQVASIASPPASKLITSQLQPAPLEHTLIDESSLRGNSVQPITASFSKPVKRRIESRDDELADQPPPKRSKGQESLLMKKDKSRKKSEKLKKSILEYNELEENGHDDVQQPHSEAHTLRPLPQPKQAKKTAKKLVPVALPSWLIDPIRISPNTIAPFTELGIPEHVSQALKNSGYEHALAIQTALLPLLLPGDRQHLGDVLVSAATGSGKTLGYVLPLVSDISRTSITLLRALVIVPTRDLVYQANKICETCSIAFSGKGRRRVKIGMACGDLSYKQEVANLMRSKMVADPAEYRRRNHQLNKKWKSSGYDTYGDETSMSENDSSLTPLNFIMNYTSKVDILICTPGRLVQHLHQTDGFKVNHVNYMVIDEADRLFEQGYQGWLEDVITSLGKSAENRTKKILLSATITEDMAILSSLNLRTPRMVFLDRGHGIGNGDGADIMNKYRLPDSLQEYYIKTRNLTHKPLELIQLFKEQNMLDESNPEERGVLVFTNSNESALRLGRLIKLMDSDISVAAITSTIPAAHRKKTLRDFQLKKLSVVVASDLVSRGLDITSLAHVVNYDFPTTMEKYVHRVGRTARAGKRGKAWTFHTSKEDLWEFHTPNCATMLSMPELEPGVVEKYEGALAVLAKEAGRI